VEVNRRFVDQILDRLFKHVSITSKQNRKKSYSRFESLGSIYRGVMTQGGVGASFSARKTFSVIFNPAHSFYNIRNRKISTNLDKGMN
jgi:hypothetical protein